MPGGDWALAVVLAGLTIATRWPYRARLLPTWDAVQFGLALDEWPPGLPRPAALEARPVPHGRSLYVLRIRRRAVDHAGYHLVPATSVAHLP